MATDIRVVGPDVPRSAEVLTPEALEFVADLQRRFGLRSGSQPGLNWTVATG